MPVAFREGLAPISAAQSKPTSWAKINQLLFNEGSGPIPPVDPLAAYAWDLRFQTHRGDGDNTPRWLWQDEEMTVPAVNALDPICVWEGLAHGRNAVQTDPDKQPYLDFVNGSPVVVGDGLDDRMIITGAGGPNSALISAIARCSLAGVGWQGIIGYGGNTGQGPMVYSRVNSTTNWGAYFDATLLSTQNNQVFKVLSAVVRAPNDVDLVTDGLVVNHTSGTGYYTTSGSQLFGEATGFTCLNGAAACVLAGPVSIPRSETDAILTSLFAGILGS